MMAAAEGDHHREADGLAALEPVVLALSRSCGVRPVSLKDAEAAAASLPAELGADFERLPGVAEIRTVLAEYVAKTQRKRRCVPGSEKATEKAVAEVTRGKEWRRVVERCKRLAREQQQRTRDVARRTAHPSLHGGLHQPSHEAHRVGRRPGTEELTNVLSFDDMGDDDQLFFQEMQGAEVLTLTDRFDLLDDGDPFQGLGHGLGSLTPSAHEEQWDPVLQLALVLHAFAHHHGNRLDDVLPSSSSLNLVGDGNSGVLAGTSAFGESEEGPLSPAGEPHCSTAEEFLDYMDGVLDTHPDVVWECGEWTLLVGLLLVCYTDAPDRSLAVADRYFTGAGPRQRLLLLRGLVKFAGLSTVNENAEHLVTFIRRLAEELPSDWVVLLDAELEEVLLALLRDVVVPYAALCSSLDPCAEWLAKWCERPSLAVVLAALPRKAEPILTALCDRLQLPIPETPDATGWTIPSHLLCSAAYMLPAMLTSSAPASDGVCSMMKCILHCLVHPHFPQHWHDTVGRRVAGALRRVAHCLPQTEYVAALCQCTAQLQAVTSGDETRHNGRPLSETAIRRAAWTLTVTEALISIEAVEAHLRRLRSAMVKASRSPEEVPADEDPLSELFPVTEQLRCETAHTRHGEALSLRVLTLWRPILPRHASLCRSLVRTHILPAAKKEDAVSVEWLVAATTSLPVWLAVAPELGGPSTKGEEAGAHLNYQLVLECILKRRTMPCETEGLDGVMEAAEGIPSPVLDTESRALLLRWCTVPRARAGLREAFHEALSRDVSSLFYSGDTVRQLPLVLPVELILGYGDDEMGSFPPTTTELPPLAKADLDRAALYQSAGLLIGIAELSVRCGVPVEDDEEGLAGAPFIAQLYTQVMQCFVETNVSEETGRAMGNAFGDDSLVTLLSAAALSVLISPAAQDWLWGAPATPTSPRSTGADRGAADCLQRLRHLRALCETRRGVDPVYFLIRFLTSGGKGRKRLAPIFLSGLAADLRVETVIPVESFVNGEEYPRQLVVSPAVEAASGLPGDTSETICDDVTEAVLFSGFGAEFQQGAAPLREAARLLRYAYPSADPKDLARLLQRRTAAEWSLFIDPFICAALVSEKLVQLCTDTADKDAAFLDSILFTRGVDVHFLVCVCVSHWLRAVPRDNTTAGTSALRASLKEFTKRGTASWVELVARSVISFAAAALREDAEVGDTVHGYATQPFVSTPLPFSSRLFGSLLMRPFALERK